MKKKAKTIFDFVGDILRDKTPWESFTETERKQFGPYMINRLLSMNPDFIDIVNYLQRYTIGVLSPEQVYKLYVDLFPQTRRTFFKYIKAKKEDEQFSEKLIEFVSKQKNWSTRESEANLKMIMLQDGGYDIILNWLKNYGFSESELKQFKLKK